MAELHALWIAAMFPAYPDVHVRLHTPCFLDRDPHHFPDTGFVNTLERIPVEDAHLQIPVYEFAHIVPGESEGGLSQIIGSEAHELHFLRENIGGQGSPRELYHAPNMVGDLSLCACVPRGFLDDVPDEAELLYGDYVRYFDHGHRI